MNPLVSVKVQNLYCNQIKTKSWNILNESNEFKGTVSVISSDPQKHNNIFKIYFDLT